MPHTVACASHVAGFVGWSHRWCDSLDRLFCTLCVHLSSPPLHLPLSLHAPCLFVFPCTHRSLPAVWNVACVLFLFMFLYAIVGMNLFGNIKQDPEGGITRHANFHSFPYAMLTEFRCVHVDGRSVDWY